jgi:hypothetical protein
MEEKPKKIIIKPVAEGEALCVTCKKKKSHQNDDCPFAQALWEFYKENNVALGVTHCYLWESKRESKMDEFRYARGYAHGKSNKSAIEGSAAYLTGYVVGRREFMNGEQKGR